jgi:hypothetical protein
LTAVSVIKRERYLQTVRRLPQRAPERALTWAVTGPVGHLVAGVLDWIELLIRLAADRARAGRQRPHEW